MSAMPSSDPERSPLVARRGFLALATRALLFLTGGCAAAGLSRYLSYEPPTPRPTRFTLEPLEAYSEGTRLIVASAGAAICRDSEGFFARSLICGHLGCRVRPSDDGGFTCPCHGSQFAGDGARRQGPTPQGLAGLALALDADGRLVLDVSSKVDAAWRLRVAPALGRSPRNQKGSEG